MGGTDNALESTEIAFGWEIVTNFSHPPPPCMPPGGRNSIYLSGATAMMLIKIDVPELWSNKSDTIVAAL